MFLSSLIPLPYLFLYFLFHYTPTTHIYTLSLHDALPIFLDSPLSWNFPLNATCSVDRLTRGPESCKWTPPAEGGGVHLHDSGPRSEEHTSELQSRGHLVCRLLLEKKNSKTQ